MKSLDVSEAAAVSERNHAATVLCAHGNSTWLVKERELRVISSVRMLFQVV